MSNYNRPSVSIVIPAYNEANRLPETLRKLEEHYSSSNLAVEIVISVEPSTDGTLALAEAATKSFPNLIVITHHEERGKGFAVRNGMMQARGRLIFFTDADLSTPLGDLENSVALFQREPAIDVIVGNRQHPDSVIVQRQSAMRESMGKTFNWIVRLLAGLSISDTQCGFKGFRSRAAKEIFCRQRLDGFSFDVEVLLLAESMGFVVREVPVHWKNSPASHVRVVQDSLRMLKDVIGIRGQVKRTMDEFPLRLARG
jgi:dolichyl-phosphate beta-glucosyltransferase